MDEDHTIGAPQVRPMPSALFKAWIAFTVFLAVLILTAPFFVPSPFFGILFNDSVQLFICLLVIALFAHNAFASRGHVRVFWFLMTVATGVWSVSGFLWFFSDLGTHATVTDLPMADFAVFSKTILMMAALAIEPHVFHAARRRGLGVLDYLLILVYWMYLYAMFVFVFTLLPAGRESYDFRFQLMQFTSNVILVATLGAIVLSAKGAWRRFYSVYLTAAVLYSLASSFSNLANLVGHVFSGGVLDAFYLVSLSTFGAVAIAGRDLPSAEMQQPTAEPGGIRVVPRRAFWLTRIVMVATLSVPVLGLWQIFLTGPVGAMRIFRVFCTLAAIFLMTTLLFFKQDLLNKSLSRSLDDASQSYETLMQFQDRLIQNEKLVSLGQTVARVANEIKQSMSSIMDGSSSVVGNPAGKESSRRLAGKINQYARRTDSLADNMLSFAQETPLRMAPVDLQELLETALKLSRVEQSGNVHVEITQTESISRIAADAHQLLQVFLHIIANAADAIEEKGSGSLVITIREKKDQVQIQFADDGIGMEWPDQVFEPFYTTKPVGKGTGLGLSASHGIVRRHHGEITCHNRPEGGAVFTISLPIPPASTGLSALPLPAYGEEV
jgi:signal transduction histidine kinase